jgi:multiple sugar transport system permease protein
VSERDPADDRRERRQLALMLAPFLLGLVVLLALPALVTVALSVTSYDLIRPATWVGLANYAELWGDGIFARAITNTVVFAAVATPLRLLVALGLALLMHRLAWGVRTSRAVVMLPTAVPEIAYGLLWLWMFNPVYGPVNALLRVGGENGLTVLGRTPPAWLTDPHPARAAVVVMSLFVVGELFFLLLVTRQSLPAELYELASLEGATAWDVFRRLTLPLLAPMLVLLLLRDSILSLQLSFVPALVLTDGGPPPYATTYLSLFVYRNGFEYLRYGYAAAATVVMLVLTVAVIAVQWRLVRRLSLLW